MEYYCFTAAFLSDPSPATMPLKRKFTMTSVAPARPSASAGELPSPAKAAANAKHVPRASQLTLEQSRPIIQKKLASAPVVVCIYKVTDKASDVWSSITDTSAALFQIQLEHTARPSVTFDIVRAFNDFLKDTNAESGSVPATTTELSQQAGIRIVVTGADDPENLGSFVQWRTGFYVAGTDVSLQNFMLLLDDFFVWKEKKMARTQPFEVRVHPHTGICINIDGMDYEHYTLNAPANSLPLKFFECHPCASKKILTLNVEPTTEQSVSVVVSGNSFSYRDRLDALGVPGGYHTDAGGAKQYFRVLKDVDVCDEEKKRMIFKMIGSDALCNLAMRLNVASEPPLHTAVSEFLLELRALPCLHSD